MDNQHRKIKGYRELREDDIAAINQVKQRVNQVKQRAAELGDLIDSLADDEVIAVDQRWLAIGKTQLQQGFMSVTRSIAKPEFF